MIDVKNLSKRFGSTQAVSDVSFKVPAGQVLGFLGPNGAGKTTTMRILTGYMPADHGSATIAGYDIFNQSLEVRKRIGYLPESAPLYMDMEVSLFLKFIVDIRKIPKREQKEEIDKIIKLCGLEGVMHKNIGELSKGYRQRVGLAQAMVHSPDILVLDEPTSGLDPNQIIEIRELIKKLGQEKTVILSTHILQEVTATCDRILIINDGSIVADGTPEELTAQASGDSTLWITVKGPHDSILTEMKNINEIENVKLISSNTKQGRLAIQFKSDLELEEIIFNRVVKNGWTLTEMHRETLSLEDVFAKLTT